MNFEADITWESEESDTPSSVLEYLHSVATGDLPKVQAMLDGGLVVPSEEQSLKNQNQDFWLTIEGRISADPLILAICCKQLEVVQFLVSRGWPLDYHVFHDQFPSPLCYARGEMLRYLVEQGMDATFYCVSGSIWGESPFHCAAVDYSYSPLSGPNTASPADALFLLQQGASPLDRYDNDLEFQEDLWNKRGEPGWDAVAHHIFVDPPITAATLKNTLNCLAWHVGNPFPVGTLGSSEQGYAWYRRYVEAAHAYALQTGDSEAIEKLAILNPGVPSEWEAEWPSDLIFPDRLCNRIFSFASPYASPTPLPTRLPLRP